MGVFFQALFGLCPDTRSGNGSAHGAKGATDYPRQARLQVLLGMIAAAEDLPEKAVEHNLKALELDLRNVDAWQNCRGQRADVRGQATDG